MNRRGNDAASMSLSFSSENGKKLKETLVDNIKAMPVHLGSLLVALLGLADKVHVDVAELLLDVGLVHVHLLHPLSFPYNPRH